MAWREESIVSQRLEFVTLASAEGANIRVQVEPLIASLLDGRGPRAGGRPHPRGGPLLAEAGLIHEEHAEPLSPGPRGDQLADGADKKGAVSALNFSWAARSCFSWRGRGARHE